MSRKIKPCNIPRCEIFNFTQISIANVYLLGEEEEEEEEEEVEEEVGGGGGGRWRSSDGEEQRSELSTEERSRALSSELSASMRYE